MCIYYTREHRLLLPLDEPCLLYTCHRPSSSHVITIHTHSSSVVTHKAWCGGSGSVAPPMPEQMMTQSLEVTNGFPDSQATRHPHPLQHVRAKLKAIFGLFFSPFPLALTSFPVCGFGLTLACCQPPTGTIVASCCCRCRRRRRCCCCAHHSAAFEWKARFSAETADRKVPSPDLHHQPFRSTPTLLLGSAPAPAMSIADWMYNCNVTSLRSLEQKLDGSNSSGYSAVRPQPCISRCCRPSRAALAPCRLQRTACLPPPAPSGSLS